MAVVKIKNPDVSGNIKTFLSKKYTSGTTLDVESSVGFANGNYVVVGEPGSEKAEVVDLTATPPSDITLTVTALKFPHPKGTPVYYSRWDKYSLEYRGTDAGSWTAYGGMPTSLEFDSIHTEYRDTAATTTFSWRYRYYSTEKAAYSDYSDTIGAAGWPRGSVGYMVREVRKIINDPESKTITDTELIRFFNKAQDIIYSLYDRWWFLLKEGTVVDTVASQKIYDLPSDFGRLHRVLFNYVDDGDTDIEYNLRYLTNIEFEYESRNQGADDNDGVKYYSVYPGDSTNETGYFHIWPTPETAGLDMTPWYYKKMTDLDSYADETEVSLPAMLEDYALAQVYKIRKEEIKAGYYDKLFREQIDLLKLEQRKSARPMRKLWRYEGRRAERRLFGTRDIYSDSAKERYW